MNKGVPKGFREVAASDLGAEKASARSLGHSPRSWEPCRRTTSQRLGGQTPKSPGWDEGEPQTWAAASPWEAGRQNTRPWGWTGHLHHESSLQLCLGRLCTCPVVTMNLGAMTICQRRALRLTHSSPTGWIRSPPLFLQIKKQVQTAYTTRLNRDSSQAVCRDYTRSTQIQSRGPYLLCLSLNVCELMESLSLQGLSFPVCNLKEGK